MTANSMFIFKEDFDVMKKDPAEKKKFSERDVLVFKESALKEGINLGLIQAKQDIEAQLIQVLATFQDQLSHFIKEEGAKREKIQSQAAQLAKAIALKICCAEAENGAVDRVMTCLNTVTKTLLQTPKITLKVNPDIEMVLTKRIEDMSQGLIVEVVADRDISKTDCYLTWDQGSAESILSDVLDQVDTVIENFLGEMEKNKIGEKNDG